MEEDTGNMPGNQSEKTGFSLATSESGFSGKVNDVFGSLDAIETKHFAKERAREKFGSKSHKRQLEDMRDYDSVQLPNPAPPPQCDTRTEHIGKQPRSTTQPSFRAPYARAPRQRNIPDYKAHPERWRSYDLSTVSTSDMSDKSNSTAALDFISQRQKQKEQDSVEDAESTAEAHSDHSKVVFKRPVSIPQGKGASRNYVEGKLRMPEYVVGEKKQREKKTANTESSNDNAKISLDLKYVDSEKDDDNEYEGDGESLTESDASAGAPSADASSMETSASCATSSSEVPVFKKTKKRAGARRVRTVEEDD